MKHLMLDFETVGQRSDTAVLSLGTVLFEGGKILDEKLWIFNLSRQLDGFRRSVSADTLLWWMNQGDKAKSVFEKTKNGMLLSDFAKNFREMFEQYPDLRVWGNGATFDVSIVENILTTFAIPHPWKFWNVRCYRTLKAMHGIEIGQVREGTHHDALADAQFQAKCLMNFFTLNPELEA